MEEFLVVSALCILENCAQIPNLVEILWELQADEVLLSYVKIPLLQVSIPALVLLGFLNTNADKGSICLDDEVANVFSEKIINAVESTSLSIEIGYMRITAEELIKGANGLALNEVNARHFLENGVLSSFVTYMKGSNTDNKLSMAFLKFLWTLATHSSVRDQLLDILQEVRSFFNSVSVAKHVLIKIKGWNFHEGTNTCVIHIDRTSALRMCYLMFTRGLWNLTALAPCMVTMR